jgi:hypothetical protein
MSANLVEQFRLRKPQRRPWDEEKPEGRGVPLANASRFLQAVQDPQMAPAPPQPEQPTSTVGGPRRFADFISQPVRLASMAAPVDSQPAPYVPPDDGLPEHPSRFLDFALKAPTTADDPLTATTQPLPPSAVSAQQRNTKPRFVDTGDQRRDLADYERRLEAWQNPIHHGNRFLAGLKEGGESFLRGGGLVGAVEGLVHGIAEPNVRERHWRDAEAARTGQRLNLLDARAKEQIGLEGQTLDNAFKRSQIFKNLNPDRKPLQHVTVDNRGYTFDPNDGTYTDAKLPGGPKLEKGTDELGLFLYDPAHPETPIVRPKGEELKQFVDAPLSTGGTARVSATEVYRGDRANEAANIQADAQGGAYQTEADNTNSQREWDAAKSQIDRDNQVAKDRYARAEVDTKALRDAITAAATKAALANNPPPHRAGDKIYDAAPEDVARYKDEAKAAVAKVHALAATVRQNYPDLVSDDELSWPTVLKAAPEPKAYPTPPRVQAKPAPAKRTGGPVPKSKDPLGLYQ